MRNGLVLFFATATVLAVGGALLEAESDDTAATRRGASETPVTPVTLVEPVLPNEDLKAPPTYEPNLTLGGPTLPESYYLYADADNKYPAHFVGGGGRRSSIEAMDNTPDHNPITNAGATLGRVLFYDKRLSANDTISCGSCHVQENGFSDPRPLSIGFRGEKTSRHSMSLSNARYYRNGRFFWDERAKTLEDQVLMPIQDPIEMGMKLSDLERKLAVEPFYPPLFEAAFGSDQITRERISFALAQFVRSMVSYRSKFDRAYTEGRNGQPNFRRVFTDKELFGLSLFAVVRGSGVTSQNCSSCHITAVQAGDAARNNGVDDDNARDKGAGAGRFKAPSLRNIAKSAPYMHDGRFATLREVLEFYGSDVKAHSYLDGRMREPNGEVRRPSFTDAEINAMLAFFDTLTDEEFLTDPKFSDPFASSKKPASTDVAGDASAPSSHNDEKGSSAIGEGTSSESSASSPSNRASSGSTPSPSQPRNPESTSPPNPDARKPDASEPFGDS